jgi:hypothetical protein
VTTTPARRPILPLLVVGLVAVLAIAVPVIAADPSPSAGPPGQQKAKEPGNPGQGKGQAKPDKGPELTKTLSGTVQQGTDDKGRPTFTVVVGGVTWELSAGPKWFYGDKSPLAKWAGKSVTVAGTYHEGETELDVETVDGQPIRDPGKPPWAGGPWVVGPSHPGWKDWMADGKPGKGHGRANAPGQQKGSTDSDD